MLFAGMVGIDGGGGVDFGGKLGGGQTRGLDSYLCWERWQERDWWTLLPVLRSFAEHMWGMVQSGEVLTYHIFELCQRQWLDIELPMTHLPLHLVDFPQLKHPLPNYTPRLVRIRDHPLPLESSWTLSSLKNLVLFGLLLLHVVHWLKLPRDSIMLSGGHSV